MNKKVLMLILNHNKVINDVELLDDISDIAKTILCEYLGYWFSDLDETGPELLNKGQVGKYIEHTIFCYMNKGIETKALLNLKKFYKEFLSSTNEEDIKEYVNKFNKEVLGLIDKDLSIKVFIDYDNKFDSEDDKALFINFVLRMNLSNKFIDKNTYILFDKIKKHHYWFWSNQLDKIILLYKNIIMDRIMSDRCKNRENIKCLGINKIIDLALKDDHLENINKYGKIKDLLLKIKSNIKYEDIKYIINEISKQLNNLKIDRYSVLFNSMDYPKLLVKEHGNKIYNLNNVKTLQEDI